MTLVDPTGGLGYGFGDLLPSADVSTAFIQLPRALDGGLGGDHDLTVDLNVLTSNNSNVRIQNLLVGKQDGSGGVFETETGVLSIINDDIQIHGLADFITNIQVGGNATVTGNITASGSNSSIRGRFRHRAPVNGTNADMSISANTTDVIYVPNGTITADRTYTLTDGQAGDRMTIRNNDNTWDLYIDNEDFTPILTMKVYKYALLQYFSGQWNLIASDGF